MRFSKTLAIAGLLSLVLSPAFGADLWRAEGQPTFVDSNGNPYAAAKLCYFDAGTTNERTVYKDAAAATAWSQPISLNAAGALDDPIYVPTGSFKEVFRSSDATTCSNGTTLFTSDDIPGAFDATELGIDYAKPDRPVLVKAADYTVQIADLGKVINVDATGGDVDITLPSAITSGDGAVLTFRKTDSSANSVTINVVGSQTIDGSSSYAIADRYDSISIVGDGANWHTYDTVVPSSIRFAQLDSGLVSTDTTLAGNSSTEIPTENAVKTYVDTVFSSGVSWLDPVVAASTTSLTKDSDIENGDTLDGVSLTTGDRVLLKDQSSASENGIWVVAASGAPTRATDIDQAAEFTGATVFISGGTANGSDTYTQTETVSTVDTDDVDWSLISSGVTYSADGVTLQKTGSTFAIKDGGVDSDAIATGAVGADEIAAGSVPKADLVTAVQEALVPAGTVLPYAGSSAPSGYLLTYGQAISRTTYSDLFSAIGTTYGNGDGSTTFNVPDLRGRVVAGQDDMGGTSANRLTSPLNGDTLGGAGGNDQIQLGINEIPAHSHDVSGVTAGNSIGHTHSGTTDSGGAHTHTVANVVLEGGGGYASGSNRGQTGTRTTGSSGSHAHTFTTGGVSQSHTHAFSDTSTVVGGNDTHDNVQPTIILNYIIKY